MVLRMRRARSSIMANTRIMTRGSITAVTTAATVSHGMTMIAAMTVTMTVAAMGMIMAVVAARKTPVT